MSNITLRLINSSTTQPARGNVLAEITFTTQELRSYEHYSFHQNFMQPADAFTFIIGADRVSDDVRAILKNNVSVYLNLETDNGDNRVISTGLIDQVIWHNDRKTGSPIEIRGRSYLAQAIDDGIDPWSKIYDFHEGITLGEMIGRVFSQYGLSVIKTTDAFDRDLVTGVNRKNGLSYKTIQTITIPAPQGSEAGSIASNASTQQVEVWIDPSNPLSIEELKMRKCKPNQHETAYAFAETHAKRFHLHIWGSIDGNNSDAPSIILGQPDYIQDPTYSFINRYDGSGTGVIQSWLQIDSVNMPACIIAEGKQGGGDLDTVLVKCAKVNEFLGYNAGAYQAFNDSSLSTQLSTTDFNSQYIKPSVLNRINRFKKMPILNPNLNLLAYQDGQIFFNQGDVKTSTIYWQDKASQTMDELQASVQRRMSEFMRNAVRYHVKVQGHDQDGKAYRYNTVAVVKDEKVGLDCPMWIEDVLFRRSRTEGTVTELKMIPLSILYFGGFGAFANSRSATRIR